MLEKTGKIYVIKTKKYKWDGLNCSESEFIDFPIELRFSPFSDHTFKYELKITGMRDLYNSCRLFKNNKKSSPEEYFRSNDIELIVVDADCVFSGKFTNFCLSENESIETLPQRLIFSLNRNFLFIFNADIVKLCIYTQK